MKNTLLAILMISISFTSLISFSPSRREDPLDKARRLSQSFIILNSHIDTPDLDCGTGTDISEDTPEGQFDYIKAKKGGLNAAFMSIYVSSELSGNEAFKRANTLIDWVEKTCQSHPDKFSMACSPEDIRSQFTSGKISLPMGMENGSPLNGNIDNLKYFFDRGIRYITLCHFTSNGICDSSTDPKQPNGGLSSFGKEVVHAMNEMGMMIDISHVSDATVEQVLEISSAPVIASHSSCRKFTPDFPRNLPDNLIRKIAEKHGVVMVNFGNMFLNDMASKNGQKLMSEIKARRLEFNSPEFKKFIREFTDKAPVKADISDVADHIDHLVKLGGIDCVGLGTDYDGVGPYVPEGLENVSKLPDLIAVLLQRGYADNDIKKICGENFLRVWQDQ